MICSSKRKHWIVIAICIDRFMNRFDIEGAEFLAYKTRLPGNKEQ